MIHIVSLSGGLASAVAADRVIARHGPNRTMLWFADTGWEDEDLYRFLRDLEKRWGMAIYRWKNDHTPLSLHANRGIIPNSRFAQCSKTLKQQPFKDYLKALTAHGAFVTVHLGLDWTEMHRRQAPIINYTRIQGTTVDFPLDWEPLAWDYAQTVDSWGIAIPRLYKLGFTHNNCGGRCVRQGKETWLRLLKNFPERYQEVEDWEQRARLHNPRLAKHSILVETRNKVETPITLKELRERGERLPEGGYPLAAIEDRTACFCDFI